MEFSDLSKTLTKSISKTAKQSEGIYFTPPNIADFMKLILANENYIKPRINGFVVVRYSDENNIKHHYDAGNDFYHTFLIDDLKAYSC